MRLGVTFSYEERIAMLRENGNRIMVFEGPTEEEQLIAVQQDGAALKFIKNPSREVQEAAIRQDPFALQFIENPDISIQNLAMDLDARVIMYINRPTYKMVEKAIIKEVWNHPIVMETSLSHLSQEEIEKINNLVTIKEVLD